MKISLDYDDSELQRTFDEQFGLTFRAATLLAKTQNRGFYVTLDGTDRPFFGTSYRRSKSAPERDAATMTMAGRWTVPAFKGKNPEYRGTINKHAYLQLTAHLHDSKESFPLGIRRGRVTEDSVASLTAILDDLPIQPSIVFADREFCNNPKTRHLRAWADRNGVLMLLAHPRNAAVQRIIRHAWHSGKATLGDGGSPRYWWHAVDYVWLHSRRDTRVYTLLVLYYENDPRKDVGQGDELFRLPNGLYATAFYTNVKVTAENVGWLQAQYRLRWSCENLHKRWKAYTGRSGSHAMFPRDLFFQTSMLLLAAYGLWRIERRARLGLGLHNPLLSHTRYFGSLHQESLAKLLRK